LNGKDDRLRPVIEKPVVAVWRLFARKPALSHWTKTEISCGRFWSASRVEGGRSREGQTGYLQAAKQISASGKTDIRSPNEETARRYIRARAVRWRMVWEAFALSA
jgi:hypothetical protein